MPPRKLTGLAVMFALVASVIVAWTSVSRRRSVSPPPFPCVATAKTGWLTAVTHEAMLRLEWGEGEGRVGVSTVNGPLRWEPRSEADTRALALKVLEPISAPIRSSTADTVSLFAGCDGVGAPWKGESQGTAGFRDCLRPLGESRVGCLRRVFSDRTATLTDEAPGAVADRITAEVSARGISLSPALTGSDLRGHHRPAPAGALDQVLDRLLPPEEFDGDF